MFPHTSRAAIRLSRSFWADFRGIASYATIQQLVRTGAAQKEQLLSLVSFFAKCRLQKILILDKCLGCYGCEEATC